MSEKQFDMSVINALAFLSLTDKVGNMDIAMARGIAEQVRGGIEEILIADLDLEDGAMAILHALDRVAFWREVAARASRLAADRAVRLVVDNTTPHE